MTVGESNSPFSRDSDDLAALTHVNIARNEKPWALNVLEQIGGPAFGNVKRFEPSGLRHAAASMVTYRLSTASNFTMTRIPTGSSEPFWSRTKVSRTSRSDFSDGSADRVCLRPMVLETLSTTPLYRSS